MHFALRALVGALLLSSLLYGTQASPALAQSGAGSAVVEAREAARALALRALAMIDQGQLEQGIALLEQAEAKFHAPTHLLYLAQAHAALGHAALAAQTYDTLTEEEIPNYTSDEFREAKRIGSLELGVAQKRVGRLKLLLVGSKATTLGPNVRVDGAPRRVARGIVYVEPGTHEIEITLAGITRAARVTVAAGELSDLLFQFGGEPAPQRHEGSGLAGASDPGPPLLVPGLILLSTGAAALVVGGVTGVLSLRKVDELSDRCPKRIGCDPADQDVADSAKLLGNASTAMFVIGGASTIAGVILMAIPGSSKGPVAAHFRPIVRPLFIGVEVRY